MWSILVNEPHRRKLLIEPKDKLLSRMYGLQADEREKGQSNFAVHLLGN